MESYVKCMPSLCKTRRVLLSRERMVWGPHHDRVQLALSWQGSQGPPTSLLVLIVELRLEGGLGCRRDVADEHRVSFLLLLAPPDPAALGIAISSIRYLFF
jgi:hypothetical protein